MKDRFVIQYFEGKNTNIDLVNDVHAGTVSRTMLVTLLDVVLPKE